MGKDTDEQVNTVNQHQRQLKKGKDGNNDHFCCRQMSKDYKET